VIELIVFKSMRDEPIFDFLRWYCPKRSKVHGLLELSAMTPACLFKVKVEIGWQAVYLGGDELDGRSGRTFIGPQRAARVSQVTKHDREAEAIVIMSAARDKRKVRRRQRIVPDQIRLGNGRTIKARHLIFRKSRSL
jgi:hypothetical protein